MLRLTLELDVQCSATALIDNDLLILAKEGTPQSHEGLNRVGERRPLIPPMGICHVAWGSEQTVNSYVTPASEHMTEAMCSHLLKALQLIRRRGYAMGANGPSRSGLRQVTVLPIGQLRDQSYWSSIFELMNRLTPKEIQLVNFSEIDQAGVGYIAAPVFSSEGSVALQLVLSGMRTNLSPKKIERCVEKLCSTAAAITSETHGRVPRL
jgi:DNA-binding IclR family transcriptional regulator